MRRAHETGAHSMRGLATKVQHNRRLRAAVRIQVVWRARLVRDDVRDSHEAVTKLAAAWRMHRDRVRHRRRCQAGSVLVGGALMWHLGRFRTRRVAAASLIAGAWRNYLWRNRFAREMRAARKIQSWWLRTNFFVFYRNLTIEILVKAKLERRRYLTKPAVTIQRWYRLYRLRPKPLKRMREVVTKLQGHYRRKRAVREVKIWRSLVGVNLCGMTSKRVMLVEDTQGRLTRCRAVEEEENEGQDAEAGCVRHIVDVKAITAEQRQDLIDVVAPVQAFIKWQFYNAHLLAIQRRWRGCTTRASRRRHQTSALTIQTAWRRRKAVLKVQELREKAVQRVKKLDSEFWALDIVE